MQLIPTVLAQVHAPNPLFVDPTLSQNYDFELFLTQIINFFLGFVGVIALLMFVIGGYYLLASGGNEEQVTKGKKTVTYAVIGIVVIVISYAAVKTITSGLSFRELNDGTILNGGGIGLPLPPIFPPFPAPGSVIDLLKIIFKF